MVEDQVKVEVFSSKTETGSADKLTVGAGVVGGVGVLPPPPPPPPQLTRMKVETIMDRLIFFIYMFYINTYYKYYHYFYL